MAVLITYLKPTYNRNVRMYECLVPVVWLHHINADVSFWPTSCLPPSRSLTMPNTKEAGTSPADSSVVDSGAWLFKGVRVRRLLTRYTHTYTHTHKPSRCAPVSTNCYDTRTTVPTRGGKRLNPRPLVKMPPKFRVLSLNAEGISTTKAEILTNLDTDIICLQETHKDTVPPRMPGMHLAIHHPSPVHGSAIYTSDGSVIKSSTDLSEGGLEILQVDTEHLNIIAVYKPPATPFAWPDTLHLSNKASLVTGDFNSHSTTWGYCDTNSDGEAVEKWAAANDLTLLYNAKDHGTFQSARWRSSYNPDLAFITSRHNRNVEKFVGNPVPRTQHRPVMIDIRPVIRPR